MNDTSDPQIGGGWASPSWSENHDHFMRRALREAEIALEEGEVPVGAVVVREGRVIGRGHNQRETLKDPTAHAEIIALTQAAASVEAWRLEDCVLYVTLEPCAMCSGAIVNARLRRVVYGAADPRAGFCGSLGNLAQHPELNHHVEVVPGVLSSDCAGILEDFFRQRRGR
jgi:tRNA(adenine34) deaminase